MNTSTLPPLPSPRPGFGFGASLQNSKFLRVLVLGFLTLLLLIPVGSIRDVIAEREQTRNAAKAEIARQWGGAQTVMGPFLVLPYRTVREVEKDGKKSIEEAGTKYGVVLPEVLDLSVQQRSEYRQRGIFTLPVYRGSTQITGRFAKPSLAAIGVPDAAIYWERAEIVMALSDLRALTGAVAMEVGEQALRFAPGSGLLPLTFSHDAGKVMAETEYGRVESSGEPIAGAVHSALPLTAENQGFSFALPLSFNGSEQLQFTPLGRVNTVAMQGDWPSPSFNGAYLPRTREVLAEDKGFTASWEIPDLSRSFGQVWRGDEIPYKALSAAAFGVRLFPAVDEYTMAHRAVKYAQLFIVMSFALWWLFEVIGGIKLHLLQYLLVGAGLCAFYLLQLALSEHFGFRLAYLVASAAVTVQITLYSWSALRSLQRAAGVGAAMSALYIYLFSVLREENYALLTGAVGLFLMLSLIMWLTRKVEWGAVKA